LHADRQTRPHDAHHHVDRIGQQLGELAVGAALLPEEHEPGQRKKNPGGANCRGVARQMHNCQAEHPHCPRGAEPRRRQVDRARRYTPAPPHAKREQRAQPVEAASPPGGELQRCQLAHVRPGD